jgi:hypothetical protein
VKYFFCPQSYTGKGAMQMYLTVDDFCQICLVIIGALGLIVALIGLIHELNKKK